MACGCKKAKTPEEVLAAQRLAEARRQVLKDRLDARRAEIARRK